MITSFKDDYKFLSNFYPCKITIAGYTFPSVENAYQAMKCANLSDYSQFVNIGPAEAKKLGRKVQLRSDWEQIKYNVMRQLLDLKFQDKVLLRMLQDTAQNLLSKAIIGMIITGECVNVINVKVKLSITIWVSCCSVSVIYLVHLTFILCMKVLYITESLK